MNTVDQLDTANSSTTMVVSDIPSHDVAKVFNFPLRSGEEVTLEVTHKLLQDVAQAFDIDVNSVSENHMKYYLVSSMKKVLESNEGPL